MYINIIEYLYNIMEYILEFGFVYKTILQKKEMLSYITLLYNSIVEEIINY